MAEEDDISVAEHEHMESVDDPHNIMGGGTDMNMPGQDKETAMQDSIAHSVREGIAQEREFYATLGKNIVKTNPNVSGSVRFGRYTIYGNTPPMMICKEKPLRGDVVIVNYTEGVTCSIGVHTGTTPLGTDTVSVVGTALGTARTIRYRGALWAVSSVDCVIDVQEEFD